MIYWQHKPHLSHSPAEHCQKISVLRDWKARHGKSGLFSSLSAPLLSASFLNSVSWHNSSRCLCLWLNHNTSHLSCSLSLGSKGTCTLFPDTPSSPEMSINHVLTSQVVGKHELEHSYNKPYTGTALCQYASLAFASLARLGAGTRVFAHNRHMAGEMLPQLLLIFTPQTNPPDRFSNSWKRRGIKARGKCLPCGLSSLLSLVHHGFLPDPGRWKRKQNEDGGWGRQQLLVRPHICTWSAAPSDTDPWPAGWFIKLLPKIWPYLLAYKWSFFKKPPRLSLDYEHLGQGSWLRFICLSICSLLSVWVVWCEEKLNI